MEKGRYTGITLVTGAQGTGKSYTTYHNEIQPYMKAAMNGRVGRSVLVFDVNNENKYYKDVKSIFFDVEEENPNKRGEPIRQLSELNKKGIVQIRKVLPYTKHGEPMTIAQMQTTAVSLMENFKVGLLLLEDTASYINIRQWNAGQIISKITRCRHLNTDIVVHIQSLNMASSVLLDNTRFVRMHRQNNDIAKIYDRLSDKFTLFKIAQIIVNERYDSGDTRFYLYIDVPNDKIKNKSITEKEFENACEIYLYTYPDYRDMMHKTQKTGEAAKREAKKMWIEAKKKLMFY